MYYNVISSFTGKGLTYPETLRVHCMRWSTAFLTAALSLAGGSQASAADFGLTPVISAAFDNDDSYTPLLGTPDPYTLDGNDRIFQIDFHASTSNLQIGERGLGSVSFDIELTGVVDVEFSGWQPNNPLVDTNGDAGGGNAPLWQLNYDDGPNAYDLQAITARIFGGISNPHATDPRMKIGQQPIPPNHSFVGSIYVLWDAESYWQVSVTDPVFRPYMNDGTLGATVIGTGGSVPVLIPEPITIATAIIGLAALIGMRKRCRKS